MRDRRHPGAWIALFLGVLLMGCAGSAGGPDAVPLADLVAQQEAYDGERVLAEGIVRTYDEPRHYWIEDADLNRVELVPPARVAPHVGARVRVEGRFTFRDDQGRRIEVERLEVVDPEPNIASLDVARDRVTVAAPTALPAAPVAGRRAQERQRPPP